MKNERMLCFNTETVRWEQRDDQKLTKIGGVYKLRHNYEE